MVREILEQLFDSPVKVRLLKLFLRNPEQSFRFKEIFTKIKSDPQACRRQMNKLEDIQLIRCRLKNKKKVYSVNSSFPFYKELKTLILKSSPASKKKMLKRLRSLGTIKLAILAGIFINADNSRIDLLLVGDRINSKKTAVFFNDLEAEVGREIDYVVLTTEEFNYRYNMFDRFLRDVLEKPHEKLVNKLRV